MKKTVNLLIPAVGAAAYLAQEFRNALDEIGGTLTLTDLDPAVATQSIGHHFYATPRLKDPAFESKVLEIIEKHQITAILPKRQQEFLWWAEFAQRHPQVGMMLSGLEALKISTDKKSSYDWLKIKGFPVAPYTMKTEGSFSLMQQKLGPLPWFAKPYDGSGTRGVAIVSNENDFNTLNDEMLLQPMLKGVEYTINLYVDRSGKCRVVIPHRRIEVKNGEVTTGVTVDEPYLIDLAYNLAKALKGLYGPICFQVFHNQAAGPMSDKTVVVTDINPRFGGGYPLAKAAGGDFVAWLLAEAMGMPLPSTAGQWTPGTRMERPEGQVKISQLQATNA